jgi:hypothetical protein
VGHILHTYGLALPPDLEEWAIAQDRPAADLGAWRFGLISINAVPQMALSRDFQGVRAFGTVYAGRYCLGFAPSTEAVVLLVEREVDAPPRGWDSGGGGPETGAS